MGIGLVDRSLTRAVSSRLTNSIPYNDNSQRYAYVKKLKILFPRYITRNISIAQMSRSLDPKPH